MSVDILGVLQGNLIFIVLLYCRELIYVFIGFFSFGFGFGFGFALDF